MMTKLFVSVSTVIVLSLIPVDIAFPELSLDRRYGELVQRGILDAGCAGRQQRNVI